VTGELARDASISNAWFRVLLRVADEDDACLYLAEHLFTDHPGAETLVRLFEEAKDIFRQLYPETEAVDFSVEVHLR